MRQPRKDRGKSKKRKCPRLPKTIAEFDNPKAYQQAKENAAAITLAFRYGALQTLALLSVVVIPGFLKACKKADTNTHWMVFKPHCPPIAHVKCPKGCPNRDKLSDVKGCHVCDCLHPKKSREE